MPTYQLKSLLPFAFIIWLALLGYVPAGTSAYAQTPAPDTTQRLPVIRPAATDTLPPAEVADDEMETLVDSLIPATDTVNVSAAAQAEIYKIVPKKATIRSAILPGWGQYYNRQYWKIPFVAAGFGTFAYFISYMNKRYDIAFAGYETAFYSTTATVPATAKTAVVTLPGREPRELDLNQLRQLTDFYRRWRDYNYVFTALFWGLNVVDANVSAHLKTFDVSDSLTLKPAPTIMPTHLGLFVPGLKLTMAFRK